MLSPVINEVKELLTQALKEVMQLDKYSITNNNIMIGKLPEDPDWLGLVRSDIYSLGQEGAQWILKRPEIWSSVLAQFPSYASSLQTIAEMQQQGSIQSGQWKNLLNSLLYQQLVTAVEVTQKATEDIKTEYDNFKAIQSLLEENIQIGWAALVDEEQAMMDIIQQMTKLQDKIQSLDSEVTSSVISEGKNITKSSVTTAYNIVTTAGSSFSYLTMVSEVFTVGRMFYEVISDTVEIGEILQEVAELQTKASEEAQALAGTQSVLQLLYSLEKSFLAIQDLLPQVTSMWEAERDKVKTVIEGISAGANPDNYFELQSLRTASVNWQELNTFALKIPTLIQGTGTPVILNTTQATLKT